jgi:hypothetical protein
MMRGQQNITTDSVNTDQSDGTKMERWRNGNVTHSVNHPIDRAASGIDTRVLQGNSYNFLLIANLPK